MYEKVNPAHPDKIADRIAGAMVDLAYTKARNPKIAVEVLIGHGQAQIISETDVVLPLAEVKEIVYRIAGDMALVAYDENKQDVHLAKNQEWHMMRCGDNGIFKGLPTTEEEIILKDIATTIYNEYGTDGKYILDAGKKKLIVCQSNAKEESLAKLLRPWDDYFQIINPLGEWTGGTNVDTGAVNRKLGSDMGEAVTGGGLHGKDLSKADVSLNIYAHLRARETHKPFYLSCAIGDTYVDGRPYEEIVEIAREYIDNVGGFERLAEWGLI